MIFFPDGMERHIEDGNWVVVGVDYEMLPCPPIDISTSMGKAYLPAEMNEVKATLRLRYIGPAEPIPDCCDPLHVVYAEEQNAT